VFGKTPPVRVEFAEGTIPLITSNTLVPLNYNKVWPPGSDQTIGELIASAEQTESEKTTTEPSSQQRSPVVAKSDSDSKQEPASEPQENKTNDSGRSSPHRDHFSSIASGRHRPAEIRTRPGFPSDNVLPQGEDDKGLAFAEERIGSPTSPPIPPGSSSAASNTALPFPTEESKLIGGSGGGPRRSVNREGRPMIGVRSRMGSYRDEAVVQNFDPLFEKEASRRGYESLYAKDGYAVGAIQVDADQYVNAIRVAFMRLDGDQLDTSDSYVSEWIGEPTGRDLQSINGEGKLVVGVHGRGTIIQDAIGLVFKKKE
jgi:hypothetical protein